MRKKFPITKKIFKLTRGRGGTKTMSTDWEERGDRVVKEWLKYFNVVTSYKIVVSRFFFFGRGLEENSRSKWRDKQNFVLDSPEQKWMEEKRGVLTDQSERKGDETYDENCSSGVWGWNGPSYHIKSGPKRLESRRKPCLTRVKL